jgi:hypothetical protein
VKHYLARRDDGQLAATACGQRERKHMPVTQDWDAVDCQRCWYYHAMNIVSKAWLDGKQL